MRILKVCAVITLQFAVGVVFSAERESVLLNGGFEKDLAPWNAAPAREGAVEILDHDFYEGARVLRIMSKSSEKVASSVSQELRLRPGCNYLLKGFVKTTGLDDGKGAFARVRKADGTTLSESGPLSTGNSWTEFLLPFNSGKGGVMSVQLVFGGADGSVLFDGLVLDDASKKVTDGDAGRKNIALNCPYVFNKEPNYAGCKDENDKVQLTDGVYTKGHFWLQKSTVGWANNFPVIVTIDLGADKPIGGVLVNTAGGAGDVTFPKNIFILLSSDGKNFYMAGDLVKKSRSAPSPSSLGYRTFSYSDKDMKTHGRFVRVFCNVAPGPYLFLDEIEVFEGEKEWMGTAYKGGPVDEKRMLERELVENAIQDRLLLDLGDLRRRLSSSQVSPDLKKSVSESLNKLEKEARAFVFSESAADFKAIFPLNDLHRSVFAEHARVMEAEGVAPIALWHKHRYAPMPLFEAPSGGRPSLGVRMLANERRAEVLNITNASSKTVKMSVKVEGLPPCFELRQMEYVDTRDLKVAATALPEMARGKDSYETSVASGMTRQVWISFDSSKAGAGTHAGRIVLTSSDGFEDAVPVKLSVIPISLPEKSSLDVGVWDYSAPMLMGINKQNQAAVIDDLKRHHVNIAFGNSQQAALPQPNGVDTKGRLTKEPDFAPFDKWRDLWKDARRYQIFLAVSPETPFAGFKRGTEGFRNALRDWGAAWDRHVSSLGLKKGAVQMHFIDEPRNPEKYQTLRDWATSFKSGSKMVDVFNDPVELDKLGNMNYAPDAFKSVDVLCPLLYEYVLNYNDKIRQSFQDRKKAGSTLYFYQCQGPNRNYDPGYFRVQPWYCFLNGMSGSMYWAYADSACSNQWNEYTALGGYSYSFVYLDDNGPVTTKHWEAFREGIQDYECLRLLEEKLKFAPASFAKSVVWPCENPNASVAYSIAEDVVERMGFFEGGKYDFAWRRGGASRHADWGRIFVLELLERLAEGGR